MKRIIIAVGGTGGHLFPAQAFVEELKQQVDVEVIFIGKGLSKNSYFDRSSFEYRDVDSMTPFRGKVKGILSSLHLLGRGIMQSLKLLSEIEPVLVVGFGSFHAFPVLVAARLKKVPFILFESNVMPGKVIRLFSKKAAFTGVYMKEAKKMLRGKGVEVQMPFGSRFYNRPLSKEDARKKLHLAPDKKTLLVLGGSQGAHRMNNTLLHLLPKLKEKTLDWQLVHLTGSDEMAKQVKTLCRSLEIPCYVKPFEKEMGTLFAAADMGMCRSGAVTVAELIHHALPSVLIPYPVASDQHQVKNALFMQEVIQGAVYLDEQDLNEHLLLEKLLELGQDIPWHVQKIQEFKQQEQRPSLASLVRGFME